MYEFKQECNYSILVRVSDILFFYICKLTVSLPKLHLSPVCLGSFGTPADLRNLF